MPGILEQAKSWRILKPGESLIKTYKQSEFFVYKYTSKIQELTIFWGEYRPPALTNGDITALEASATPQKCTPPVPLGKTTHTITSR